MRRRNLALALPLALTAACLSSGAAGAKPGSATTPPTADGSTSAGHHSAWYQYHRTAGRSGVATGFSGGALSKAWAAELDGSVYGEPLYVNGDLIVATENDSVYSLSPVNGHVIWRRHLGQPQNQDELQCGDINPLGITGTPAYDASTGSVFVVAETEGAHHTLWALNATSGKPRWHKNMDLLKSRDRATEQQRSALLVADGRVFTSYGGLAGDCGNYIGYTTSTSVTGKGTTTHYAVPSPREAGMWSPAGPVLGDNGHVYVASGNGAELNGKWDKSDSVTELSPKSLHRVSVFAPKSWRQDNQQDLDLGSSSPVMVGHRVVIAGKRGVVYLLRQHFHGIGHALATTGPDCKAFGGAAVRGHVVIMPCIDGVRKLVVRQHSLHWGWTASGVYGSPIIAGKQVYVANRNTGTLQVLSLKSGHQSQSVATGSLTHFPSATLVDDHVYVPTLTGITALKAS